MSEVKYFLFIKKVSISLVLIPTVLGFIVEHENFNVSVNSLDDKNLMSGDLLLLYMALIFGITTPVIFCSSTFGDAALCIVLK